MSCSWQVKRQTGYVHLHAGYDIWGTHQGIMPMNIKQTLDIKYYFNKDVILFSSMKLVHFKTRLVS